MQLRRSLLLMPFVCAIVTAAAFPAQAQTTAAAPQKPKVSMAGYPSQGEPAKVTVISTGAAPKQALRYSVPATFKGKLEMLTTMAMTLMVMGQPMDQPVPTIKIGADLAVTGVAPNGDITYTVTFTGLSLDGDASGPLGQMLQAGGGGLTGVKATTVMTSRGVAKSTDMEVADPTMKAMMSQMSASIENLSSAFPEEPVGVGAKWEVRQAISGGGQTQFQKSIYEVTSIAGKTVSLKVTSDQTAPPQTIDNPMAAAAGGEMTLDKMTGTGTATITMSLDSLIPSSTTTTSQSTAMTMTMAGQTVPVTAEGKITITIGPVKDK